MLVDPSDRDVPKSAFVPQRDGAIGVDPVLAHAEVHRRGHAGGSCLETGVEGDQRCPSTQSAVWPVLVVRGAEGIELEMLVGVALVAVLSLTAPVLAPPDSSLVVLSYCPRSVYARDSAGRRGKVRREAHRVVVTRPPIIRRRANCQQRAFDRGGVP